MATLRDDAWSPGSYNSPRCRWYPSAAESCRRARVQSYPARDLHHSPGGSSDVENGRDAAGCPPRAGRRVPLSHPQPKGVSRACAALGVTSAGAGTLWRTVHATPKRGGHFIQALRGGATDNSLDGTTLLDTHAINTSWQVRSNLTEILPNGDVVGELAESWEASADASQWRFKLRKGVEFHNGRSLSPSGRHLVDQPAPGGRLQVRCVRRGGSNRRARGGRSGHGGVQPEGRQRRFSGDDGRLPPGRSESTAPPEPTGTRGSGPAPTFWKSGSRGCARPPGATPTTSRTARGSTPSRASTSRTRRRGAPRCARAKCTWSRSRISRPCT